MKCLKPLRPNHGFTLIELMVVVAIIGIGTAMAFPRLQSYVARGKQAEGKIRLAAVYGLQRQFFSYYFSYHMGMEALSYPDTVGSNHYRVETCTGATTWAGTVSGYVGPSGNVFRNYTTTVGPWTGSLSPACNITACASVGNNPQTFSLRAYGQIRHSYAVDGWTMDINKTLVNCGRGY